MRLSNGRLIMPDVKWIKLTTDMFDDEKIAIIESMPDADALEIIWIKLICQAGKCNDGGYIYLTEKIPFTEETLATILHRPLNTVRLALDTFKKLEMIETGPEGVIYLPNFEKHQNIDGLDRIRENTRRRVAAFRERHKQELLPEAVTLHVTECNGAEKNKSREDIEEEKEEEIYIPINFNNKTYKIPFKKLNGDIKIQDGKLFIFYQTLENSLLIAQGKREALNSARKQHQEMLTKLGIDWKGDN